MTTPDEILELISEEDIEFIDFRFTDPRGKCQHTTYYAEAIDEEKLTDGIMFDGSSIAGWKAINESDMILKPDLSTAFIDPFTAQPTLVLFCDVLEPETGANYGRDPRSTARRAEAYLKYSGIGDAAFFGPELEFFVFDDVRFEVSMNTAFYALDSAESPENSGTMYETGNMGHRPRVKGGYFPVPPVDSLHDMRAEMVTILKSIGLLPYVHHHEVAPAQHEIGFKFDTLTATGDNVQKYKYVVQQVAASYGKTATFMPKPIAKDNGSGMHVHQSIWKADKPLFSGNGYADLSEMCLYYIGGIFKHARAINAFTNPSTNSYKRLVPGFEAPVLLAYSSRNRSASIRVPYVNSPKEKRIETRFPDATSNPYLAFTALLMAGLDGIENKIHPGDAMDKNLYDLPPEELKDVPTVCHSLRQALESLDADREFLKKGDVMTDDQIDAYIELKMEELQEYEQTPHPVEFKMYYSV
ncbi:MAG: type I glutamate--ammonia ligase [Alphaproteobacteria bacterium]|nr:MAG: type I glutamate--ammonia ligase [Alphaproteobacteria bacterium]TAF13374.1 MAG: type I glutamate--ammonia ligase [Alphaproteobacteria bacterium]TAF39345.1 MAG: type I glutamate--ammonia ligase [Alphaproteobacteria bacterium]TAF75131.1 MAG: type I glutamate--ammonia ligase [Alphaproteobacteria bacterium]